MPTPPPAPPAVSAARAGDSGSDLLGDPAEIRQRHMANLVESSGFTRVTELAEHFAASTVTVRSGLAALEAYGRRRRVHGGMPPVSLGVAEKPLELTASEQAAEKLSISTQAAALVSTATS